uniref:Uncharacterized protein n=1 Tax=Arundo donax TaxID=35708 RepID=A0A0A9CMK1_ARUDO
MLGWVFHMLTRIEKLQATNNICHFREQPFFLCYYTTI